MTAARRTKVKNRRGIYFRIDGDGQRRYEITFLDEQRRRRWLTVDGNLETAQAELDERKRRRRAREPVAPGKVRFADFADTWLAGRVNLRPSTRALYRIQLDAHVLPRLGRLYLHDVRASDIAELVAEMGEGWCYRREGDRIVREKRTQPYSGYTIRGVTRIVNGILVTAVVRGHIAQNPMVRLEKAERPKIVKREMRILDSGEIDALLAKAGDGLLLLAVSVFGGLRQSEALGLVWSDIDLDAGTITVRAQLDRQARARVEPKTEKAKRTVELMPALVRLLRDHKKQAFAKGQARPENYVFASAVGTPLHQRNLARRILDPAMEAAGLVEGKSRLRWHDLRHTFASILISHGHDILFVSRQLGHASTQVTLDLYGHLFDRAKHAQRMRDALEADFGEILSTR